MTQWMCINCGYLLSAPSPPNECPGCKQICAFNDVTCYRPECGGEQNVDPLLVGATLKGITGTPIPATTRARTAYVETPTTVELFEGLTDEQKAQIRDLGTTETYEPGVAIFHQNDEAQKLYIVEEGRVAIQAEVNAQKRVPICTVSKGELFGWSSLVPPYRLTASAISLERTTVLAIEGAKLRELFQRSPAIGCPVMQNIAQLISSRLKNLRLELMTVIYV